MAYFKRLSIQFLLAIVLSFMITACGGELPPPPAPVYSGELINVTDQYGDTYQCLLVQVGARNTVGVHCFDER